MNLNELYINCQSSSLLSLMDSQIDEEKKKSFSAVKVSAISDG